MNVPFARRFFAHVQFAVHPRHHAGSPRAIAFPASTLRNRRIFFCTIEPKESAFSHPKTRFAWLRCASRKGSEDQRMRDPSEELSVRLGSSPDGLAG